MPERDKNWAWDLNWKTGLLSSLCSDNKKGPDPGAKAGWNRFFETLPQGAVMLDICTGNGLVPTLAIKFSVLNRSGFIVTGIDQAAIDPHTTVKTQTDLLRKASFKGGVNAEALPFPDATFDVITGQYALEYTDISKTGKELFRVLKPGGKARFVIHAKESAIVVINTPKAKQYDFILRKSGLFEALGKATKLAFEYEESGDPNLKMAVLEARSDLRDKVTLAKEEIQKIAQSGDILAFIDDLVQAYITRGKFRTWQNFESKLQMIRDQVESLREMLKALPLAARSHKELLEISKILSASGLKNFSMGEVRNEGKHLHGWTLECSKPHVHG